MTQTIDPSQHATELWWALPGELAGMPAPFIHPQRGETPGAKLKAFPDGLPPLWKAGIRAVVCMLDLPAAPTIYEAAGFTFHPMPVDDGEAPTLEQLVKFVGFVTRQRALKRPVAVHCAAGVGRTGTALAGYLMAAQGLNPDDAISSIRAARPGAVETSRQVQFLRSVHGMSR